MNEEPENKDIEKPEDIIDDITETLDDLHANLVEDATKIGEARDRFEAIKPQWVGFGNASTSDPDAAEVYKLAVNALSSIRDDYKSIADQHKTISGLMGTVSASSFFAASATGSTAGFVSPLIFPTETKWLQPIDDAGREKTRKGLTRLDPSLSLAKTYDGIWEVLYATRSDPERGSLFMFRQVFDHFFGVLAPDANVRASEFWHKKGEPDPEKVERMERIEYAASVHIKREATAKRLIASGKHVLKVYKALNKAHKRGTLDQSAARNALKEMQSIIEDWVEALYYS
jgi:hypothetical protein